MCPQITAGIASSPHTTKAPIPRHRLAIAKPDVLLTEVGGAYGLGAEGGTGAATASGAASTINRLIDAFPVSQQAQIRIQLSTALMAVLSQQLLKRIDKKGMVAAYEFMVVTPGIAHMIRDNKSFRIDSMIQTGKKFGMQLLDDHLWDMYEKGMISAEDMIDRSKNSEQLAEKVHRAGGQVGRVELDEADASAG